MIRKIKTLLPFLLLSSFLYAQGNFDGTVYNNMSLSPENGVIITVYVAEVVVFYTKSAKDGTYTLKVKDPDNKTVIFRKIGFEDFEIPFQSLQKKVFVVPTNNRPEFLEEVVVTAEKDYIHSKNDTTTYTAGQLRTTAATTVEDLIQNIPGVSIDKLTGAIRYQNREISNILIDGDNVTDKNYQVISKSLSQEAAKAIQVIEGYSENEMLKNFDRQNKVALNLQTNEEYRNKIKGSLKAGYGIKDRYDENANLIFISKKSKSINIAGYNNIGNFSLGNLVSSKNFEIDEQPLLNQNELDRINLYGNYDNQLRLSLFNTINVLENNDFTVSTNQIYNLEGDGILKSNITYYNDRIHSSVLESIVPYDPNNNSILSDLESVNKRENIDAKVEFSKVNDEREKILLRTQFKNRHRYNKEFGIQNNDPFSANGEIDNPEVRFMVDYTKKIGNKSAMVLFNNTTISNLEEDDRTLSSYKLHFLDTITTNSIVQNLDYKVFKNNFGANYAYKISTNNVLTGGLLFTNYDLNTNSLFRIDKPSQNRSSIKQKIAIISPQLQWSFFSKEHSISILAKADNIYNRRATGSSTNFELTPEVNYQFKRITPNLHNIKIDVLAQRSLDFYDFYGFDSIPLQQNSNYFYLNNNPSQIYFITNRFGINSLYGFEKSDFEITSDVSYAYGRKPLIDNFSFFENYYYNEVLEKDNDFKNFNAKFGFKKYFASLGSSIELLPSYSNSQSKDIIDGETNSNNLKNYQIRLNIGTALTNTLNISLGSIYNYSENMQEDLIGNKSITFVRSFSGYFNTNLTFSDEKFLFNIQNQYLNYDSTGGFLYSSILSKYKPENSKFEFGLSFKNIFNNDSLYIKKTTNNFLYKKETTIIPRLVVFTVNYVL